MLFSDQFTGSKSGDSMHLVWSQTYESSGGAAQTSQPAGLMGEHTVPGLQPHVRSERGSNCRTGTPGALLGAAQTLDAVITVVVTVTGGTMMVVGVMIVAPG